VTVRFTRLLIAAIVWVTWAGAAEAFVFADDAGKFVVSFPAEPKHSTANDRSNLGPHVLVTWAVAEPERNWSVTYVDYPVTPERDYDRNVEGLITRVNGTLVRQHDLAISGVPAREALVAAGGMMARQRLVLVDGRLYMLMYVGPAGTETSPEVDSFLNSFRLLR
jgi:hypothetical protein